MSAAASARSTLAPVALFAYNRLDHLQRAINSLRASALAGATPLVVFSDAPKRPEHEPAVREVREYLSQIGDFASIEVVLRTSNLGLASSIIDGVTRLCGTYGRVIVVEDDLLLAPEFLEYMNIALDRYENETRVMQVSGYMYPVREPERLPETFFLRMPTTWGWGTWARAWAAFEPDARALAARLRDQGLEHEFDLHGSYPYFDTLLAQASGELDVWGARWYASVFLAGGLCLYPARALVHNAGMDGSGIHCGPSEAFDVDLAKARIGVFPSELRESMPAATQIEAFFRSLQVPRVKRLMRFLGKRLRPGTGPR